jgi:hypothetical protein
MTQRFKEYLSKYQSRGFTCFSFKMDPCTYSEEKQKYIKGNLHCPKGWQNKSEFGEYKSSHNVLAIRLDSKLMVLDIDNVDDWKAFLLYHGHDISEFKDIPQDSTPNQGIHYYFKSNENFSKTMIKFLDLNGRKLDKDLLSGSTQMVFVEPSYLITQDHTKLTYNWKKSIIDNDLPPLPTWFENHLQSKKDTLLPKSQVETFKKLEQSHIDLFKSNLDNSIFQEAQYLLVPDQTRRYGITLPKGKAWHCFVCKRKHLKNSNRPFLYFSNDESLWYSCRGKGSCIKVISSDKFDLQIAKDKYEQGSPVFMEYLNGFLAKVTDLNNIWYCFRSCTKSAWIIRRKKDTRGALEHQSFTLKDEKLVQIFEYWIKQSSIYTFKTIVLDPSFVGDIPGEKLNLFKGFKATI